MKLDTDIDTEAELDVDPAVELDVELNVLEVGGAIGGLKAELVVDSVDKTCELGFDEFVILDVSWTVRRTRFWPAEG